jgi:hypothetical protein
MQLNKLKLYTPVQGGGSVSDLPYDEALWDGITTVSPSMNTVRDMIEALGYAGHIAIVDDTYGNDFTARADNILKPFKTHQAAIWALPYGVPCLIVTMPGTYTIYSPFGFPIRDNVDHCFLNATVNFSPGGFSYGSILVYPSYVKCRLFGKATFNNQAANQEWAMITPYVQCDLEIEGIKFTGARPPIGQLGGFQQIKNLYFKNCSFDSSVNIVSPVTNAGNNNAIADTFITMEDCHMKGSLYISAINAFPSHSEYLLKATRCKFEGGSGNPSGINAAIALLDYASSAPAKVFIKDCMFKTAHEALYAGVGYVGAGTGSLFYLDNNRFDTGPEGWIRNEVNSTVYKMLGNYSIVGSTGAFPVTNSLAGSGIVVEPGLIVTF